MIRPLVAVLLTGFSFALGGESDAPGRPADPQLALDGYCAVSGVEHQVWIKGEPNLSVDHKGLRYLFLSEEEQELFRQSPKKYALALGGRDVVEAYTNSAEKNARPVNGTREFAGRHEGRTYLFSTMKNMETFFKSPDVYVQHVDAIENLEQRLEALEGKRGKTLRELDK